MTKEQYRQFNEAQMMLACCELSSREVDRYTEIFNHYAQVWNALTQDQRSTLVWG